LGPILDACKESLTAQDYPENEIAEEAAGIRTQLAYIYQLTNRSELANEIYEDIIKLKSGFYFRISLTFLKLIFIFSLFRPSDGGVLAVAYNNITLANKNQKLFNAEKSLFNAHSVDPFKLSEEQREAISFNRAVVYLKMGKVSKILFIRNNNLILLFKLYLLF
jgi:hypothetical protein